VELGASLRDDLERRDFTVNAIALHLADGELTFYARAEADLGARVLRVLHDRSFLDDPTRLLRLARYSARLGFEPEPETDRLAADAIAGGALETVTGSRLGAELRLLLREPQPAALLAFERHGLGRALLGADFAVDAEAVRRAVALAPPRPDLAAFATTFSDAARRLQETPTFSTTAHLARVRRAGGVAHEDGRGRSTAGVGWQTTVEVPWWRP